MQAGGHRFDPDRLHQPSLKLRLASQLRHAKADYINKARKYAGRKVALGAGAFLQR